MGKSLRTVCKQSGMPAASTVFLWLRGHSDFSEQYARAKVESSDAMAEDIIDISDDASGDVLRTKKVKDEATGKVIYLKELDRDFVERSKLRVETRKWLMSKMQPKKYGDKLDLTNNGKDFPTPLLTGLAADIDALPSDDKSQEDSQPS